jgi:carbon storage regulator
MLVLSRKRDTAVRIGPNIEVKVLSIRNQQVKLGIEAPNGVGIWRDEISPDVDASRCEARKPQTRATSSS